MPKINDISEIIESLRLSFELGTKDIVRLLVCGKHVKGRGAVICLQSSHLRNNSGALFKYNSLSPYSKDYDDVIVVSDGTAHMCAEFNTRCNCEYEFIHIRCSDPNIKDLCISVYGYILQDAEVFVELCNTTSEQTSVFAILQENLYLFLLWLLKKEGVCPGERLQLQLFDKKTIETVGLFITFCLLLLLCFLCFSFGSEYFTQYLELKEYLDVNHTIPEILSFS